MIFNRFVMITEMSKMLMLMGPGRSPPSVLKMVDLPAIKKRVLARLKGADGLTWRSVDTFLRIFDVKRGHGMCDHSSGAVTQKLRPPQTPPAAKQAAQQLYR